MNASTHEGKNAVTRESVHAMSFGGAEGLI